ncbi:MAG: HEAT repeat domain-containing protein [bacterium]
MRRARVSVRRTAWRAGITLFAVTVALVLCLLPGCSKEQRLDRDLQSKDPAVRAAAARQLGKERPEGAAARLIRLLDDRSARVRIEAATALGRLKATAAANPLGAALRDGDPSVRLAAVRALATLGRDAAADHLLTAVQDVNRRVRRTARFALQDLGVPQAEQQRRIAQRRLYKQRRMLVNRIPSRRIEALKALGRSGRRSIVADLEQLVGDPYVGVAEEAAAALGMVGGGRALAFLERLSAQGEHHRKVARRGFLALLSGREPPARALAIRLLNDDDTELREAALEYMVTPIPGVERPTPAEVCRVLLDRVVRRAVRSARRLRRAGVRCPERLRTQEATRIAALTRPAPLPAATAAWVRTQLGRPTAADDAAVALAAHSLDARLQELALTGVQASYKTLLETSERWLDEPQWKRLARLPTSQGAVIGPTPPLPVAQSEGSKQGKLDRLLQRFPDHSGTTLQELMPPQIDVTVLTWQLRALAEVKGAWAWLSSLAKLAPVDIRVAAFEALGRSGCELDLCRKALELGCGDSRAEVRTAAVTALRRAPGTLPAALAETLILLLGDPALTVRSGAALALARGKTPKAYPALLDVFRKSRQTYLVEAFGALGDPRAERVLLGLLREDHSPLNVGERLAVIEALGRVGTRAALERLVPELDHTAPAIRRAAALVLARIGDRRALDRLAVCAEDFYRAVRVSCAAARQKILKKK